jgi:hypothetical protein
VFITVRDPIAERGLRAIAAAVVMSLTAQRAALDRHGPIATTRGPHDRGEGMRCAVALTAMLRTIETASFGRQGGTTVDTGPGE